MKTLLTAIAVAELVTGIALLLAPSTIVALLLGLLTYNVAIPVVLIHSYVAFGTRGTGLWPVVALHLAFVLWLAACMRSAFAAGGSSAR